MKLTDIFLSEDARLQYKGILNSYSQIFFSENKAFAWILLPATFLDPYAGFFGLFSLLVSNFTAYVLGLNIYTISRGLYGFNSLLTGLGLGVYFSPGWHLLFMVAMASLITLGISVALEGVVGKYALPYLSLPFVFASWLVMLALLDFTALGISERGIYFLNELYQMGGDWLISFYNTTSFFDIWSPLRVYFISLAAIFFQYNLLTGILIAVGLLYYSRIAFSLSLLGFFAAYAFYSFIGANLNDLNYSYIGFNYILTAIAIGGFFIIPSRGSYSSVLLLIPMLALVTTGLGRILSVFNLPVYSLPFNLTVLIFLYLLKFRTNSRINLSEVVVQQNSPEKNLYSFQNHILRFGSSYKMPFRLPFYGEWIVTQGHNGEFTHKENWRHAWDFEIADDEGKTFQNKGDYPHDYYCFAKPVLATADGEVIEVVNDIEDNVIGTYNLTQNWGNTIVIKHADYLFSKISHLKKGSAKVKKGDFVKAGQPLAQCGNSGRSPYPHLHFQFQTTPWIGAGTYNYPFRHIMIQKEKKHQYMAFYIPEKNEKVCNIEVNPLLKNAFQLVPGQQLKISGNWNDKNFETAWIVGTNMYNKSYIYCLESKSMAWFENDGSVWFFTHFEGKKNTLLYYFYLAAFKVQLGYYHISDSRDPLPVNQLFSKKQLFFQDFTAPFFMYLRASYHLKYTFIDDKMSPNVIFLESQVSSCIWKKRRQSIHFEIKIDKNGISKLNVTGPSVKIESVWESM